MTDELRKKFGTADEALSAALHSYIAGKGGKSLDLERSGQDKVNSLKSLIDEVEKAVQQCLRYEEA